jgi:hypothetical protein
MFSLKGMSRRQSSAVDWRSEACATYRDHRKVDRSRVAESLVSISWFPRSCGSSLPCGGGLLCQAPSTKIKRRSPVDDLGTSEKLHNHARSHDRTNAKLH